MQVNLQYAEQHLADLAAAVDEGQEVEIARPNKPTLKLVASAPSRSKGTGSRTLGAGRGELRVPSPDEWKVMDQELADEMNNSPLFPAQSR